MGDIRIVWDPSTGTGDLQMGAPAGPGAGADLATGLELETALLISLFTDGQADPGDRVTDTDPRGWWADTYAALEDPALPTISTYRIGSKLWQVFARPRDQQTLNWMGDQIRKSLAWMLTDGVASAIDVTPVFTGPGGVGAAITITANGIPVTYTYAWNQELGVTAAPALASAAILPAPPPLTGDGQLTDEAGNPLFDEAGNPEYDETGP